MRERAKTTPPQVHSITPFLFVADAAAALDYYVDVFGGVEVLREKTAGGQVRHAQVRLGDSILMISGLHSEMSPQSLGGTGVHFYFHVEDVDGFFAKAIAAGATVVNPIADQPWGDRVGALKDPFGHTWYVATHLGAGAARPN